MAQALRLASKGLFTTHPNPRVGCVLARNEQILGQGWHARAGGAHAEIGALADVAKPTEGATAYVTLEPCSHHGKTAPCVDALIEAGISRVVVASIDPNPLVSGKGLERLKQVGIRVESGLMSAASEELNAGFFKRMRKGLPWVRVKSAISLDGRTALANGASMWISSEESRLDVQRWRARSSAILTGIGTVLADNPRMTSRLDGLDRQPLRVIADSRWRTPAENEILAEPETAIVAGDRSVSVPEALIRKGVACLPLEAPDGRISLTALLSSLAQLEVNEVQVEAGSVLCGALLKDALVDEILIYQAPLLLGDGGPGPFALGPLESVGDGTHLKVLETVRMGRDTRIRLLTETR